MVLQGVTTATSTIGYERLSDHPDTAVTVADTTDQPEAPRSLLTLFWAGIALFAVNLVLLFCGWMTPELRVNMYGAELLSPGGRADRPSPFAEVVPAAPRQVKPAARVFPILAPEWAALDANAPAPTAQPETVAVR